MSGGHYNPEGLDHGGPEDKERHVGDLGNVEVGEDGRVKTALHDDKVALNGGWSVLGRAVMLHSDQDDLGRGGDDGSRSTGNAGSRVASCTLAVKEDEVVEDNTTGA